jgi:hypothetical protein
MPFYSVDFDQKSIDCRLSYGPMYLVTAGRPESKTDSNFEARIERAANVHGHSEWLYYQESGQEDMPLQAKCRRATTIRRRILLVS